mmetsp:Transcript_120422/g.348050  ORF Transcript_120422/g.348050 Transcript_120422/m.348050 type:complete len:346 (-) Transcript_120422:76-1113(-)
MGAAAMTGAELSHGWRLLCGKEHLFQDLALLQRHEQHAPVICCQASCDKGAIVVAESFAHVLWQALEDRHTQRGVLLPTLRPGDLPDAAHLVRRFGRISHIRPPLAPGAAGVRTTGHHPIFQARIQQVRFRPLLLVHRLAVERQSFSAVDTTNCPQLSLHPQQFRCAAAARAGRGWHRRRRVLSRRPGASAAGGVAAADRSVGLAGRPVFQGLLILSRTTQSKATAASAIAGNRPPHLQERSCDGIHARGTKASITQPREEVAHRAVDVHRPQLPPLRLSRAALQYRHVPLALPRCQSAGGDCRPNGGGDDTRGRIAAAARWRRRNRHGAGARGLCSWRRPRGMV